METSTRDLIDQTVTRGWIEDCRLRWEERERGAVKRAMDIVLMVYGPALRQLGEGVIPPPHTHQKAGRLDPSPLGADPAEQGTGLPARPGQ